MSSIMPAADLTLGEPVWLFQGSHVEREPVSSAAKLLERLDQRDFTLMVLTYGLGMRVGEISRAVRLDPALVIWRLHDVFHRWVEERGEEGEASALERALRDLLHGDGKSTPPPPLNACASWRADDLVDLLDSEVLQRLHANIHLPTVVEKRTPGLGIGLAILIGLGSLAFLGYGVVRDISVMMRGHDFMREGNYSDARSEFRKEGTPEATKWIMVSLVADGRFDEALDMLAIPSNNDLLGAFAPSQKPIAGGLEYALDSRAILPRGLINTPRPELIVATGTPAEIVLSPQEGRDRAQRRFVLEDTRDQGGIVTVPFPEDWPSLRPGRYVWRVDDGEPTSAAFDLADPKIAAQVRQRNWRFLTRQVPPQAQYFLAGHHFLNAGLTMQAGRQFGKLANYFPSKRYPHEQVDSIATALGVDPIVFLR
jgi:hypothetical protein